MSRAIIGVRICLILELSDALGETSMAQVAFIPLPDYQEHSPEEMNHRAAEFYDDLRRRRTVREFSDQPVPVEVIKDCLRAAGTAPNGANMQPWHFVVVSDRAIKQKIRVEAEKEEYEFYHHKAPKEWLDAQAPLGTNEYKPSASSQPSELLTHTSEWGVLPD